MLLQFLSIWDRHLGRIGTIKHKIKSLPSSNPVYSTPFRSGPTGPNFQQFEVEEMLSQNNINPPQTEWETPVVFAPKKDKSHRFCVDSRKLKNPTRCDSFPIPRMDACIESLGMPALLASRAKRLAVFSTLSANRGYYQLKVKKSKEIKL